MGSGLFKASADQDFGGRGNTPFLFGEARVAKPQCLGFTGLE
jgi:hypothetical protein